MATSQISSEMQQDGRMKTSWSVGKSMSISPTKLDFFNKQDSPSRPLSGALYASSEVTTEAYSLSTTRSSSQVSLFAASTNSAKHLDEPNVLVSDRSLNLSREFEQQLLALW
eukprot:CAMPEP_0185831264 /NCGR_PEP_ID=MMETSP1353-20130828/1387_1 /TAXON_ID=1077150 /ORGANISM="Erythrolobus australicus, Strain CCMP3124" /LENGTH=111 /DNA_ID=CAMNT_0028529309 /DNA_START=67 /DNA_END=399 /DNA_ORIENTATION=+